MGNSHKYLIWWEFFNTIIIILKSFTIRSIGKWMQILVGMIIKRYTSSAILKQHSIYGLYYWDTKSEEVEEELEEESVVALYIQIE